MKYLKTYEEITDDVILYKCSDFVIAINKHGIFEYYDDDMSQNAIVSMADLIITNSKYLNDNKLRDIELEDRFIEYITTNSLDDLYGQKIENIKLYRTSEINSFLKDKNGITSIPEDAYINITIKYYPIISNAIKESKTLGDIIDRFRIIVDELDNNLPMYLDINKYNL